jgi:hypothetical protein
MIVASAATTTPAITTAAAAATATIAAIAATASATTAASSAAIFARSRFVDCQVATIKVGAVKLLNCFLTLFTRSHFHEAKAT